MMLTRHTVHWFDTTDPTSAERITVYVTPGHHTERDKANERNLTVAKNRPDYDDACAMGRAAIIQHVKEADSGAA